jgi:hypothetical protein
VIPVLDSHEMVRRQLLHFERIGLPKDTELILVDDGSDPPIENTSSLPVTIHRTNDKRPWTWALARNAGAQIAKGEYLLMYDLDHIVTKDLLYYVRRFRGPGVHFIRKLAMLDEQGVLRITPEALRACGLKRTKIRVESHHNSFAIRRDLFWELGGYIEDMSKPYPRGEDSIFYKAWLKYLKYNGIEERRDVPTLFVIPSGRWCGDVDYNPQGLFHNLSRKTGKNYWWRKQIKEQHDAIR